MNWDDIKRKTKKEEQIFVIGLIILLVAAAAGEMFVKMGHVLLYVLNYDAVSLVIIQIQATVQTLSIALLALASGRINESHMGIDYNDFQFNIRPAIFTQKRIVLGSIIFLVANVFLHMLGLYNMVVAVFLTVCILIYISVKEIYAIFVNGMSANEEIEAYMMSFTKEDMSDTKVLTAFKILCSGWRNDLESQSTSEYEKYQKIFGRFLEKLLLLENPEVQADIEKETVGLIRYFCQSGSTAVKEKGFRFLNDFYDKAWYCITDNREKAKTVKRGIHIFSEMSDVLTEAESEVSLSVIEKRISLERFTENVALCHFWLDKEPENSGEMDSLSDWIVQMLSRLKTDATYHSTYWGSLVKHLDTRITTWPEMYATQGNAAINKIQLRYAISLIRNGQVEILKESYYNQAVRHIGFIKMPSEGKLFLKVQCYLFYLAYYEKPNYISLELRDMVRRLLEDTKGYFRYGAERICRYETKNPNTIFNEKLINELVSELSPFECFSWTEDVKTLVMSDVVNDFVVFLALYLSNRYHQRQLISNIISKENEILFYMRYFQDKASVERFSNFLQIIECDKKPQILFGEFRQLLKAKIKATQMEQAHEEYIAQDDQQDNRKDFSKKMMDYLNEKFKPIISENAKKTNLIRVRVLKLNAFSNMTLGSIVKGQYDVLANQLIQYLCALLKDTDSVDVIGRETFTGDEVFFDFLNKEENNIIIGSEFSVCPSEYFNREALDAILEQKHCILDGYTEDALILNEGSLEIYIHDVKITAHSGTMREEKVEYDAKTDCYSYEVVSGVPVEFTEAELRQYLHNKKKVVDIALYISVKKKPGKIGTLLVTGRGGER